MLYFKVAPETGSKVLRVSVARGALGSGAGIDSVGSFEDFNGRGLGALGEDGGCAMVYFEDLRVCSRC